MQESYRKQIGYLKHRNLVIRRSAMQHPLQMCIRDRNKADQFWGEIQENTEEKQQSSKILFLNTLSDEELLREIHECKIEYKEAEIIILDGQSGYEKKDFDHNTVA